MHTEKTMRAPAPLYQPHWSLPRIIAVSGMLAVLLALAFASSVFGVGTVLLGNQSIASTPDSNQPGQAEAFQFTATTSGTLGSLTVYLDSSSSATQLIAGLYANSGQNPGGLLSQGSSTVLAAGAWNSMAIPPVSVTAGTVYWIAILGTGGTLKYRDSGANCVSQTSAQVTLTTLPATWTVGSRWFSCTLSAYGSASTSSPILSISQSTLSFIGTQGSGTNPAASTVNVTNTGGGSLPFTASSDSSWLSVTPGSGTAPQTLQISATLGILTAGTYTGHVTVTAAGAQGSPATITATFSVAAPSPVPSLSVSPTTLSFAATQGSGSNPAASTVGVTNTGGGSLTFSAGSDSSWLSVTPGGGTAPQTLQISAILGTLTPATYTGHITVTAMGAQGSPATITVAFNVTPADVAPVISGVGVSSITSSGAVIGWTTDKASSSQVNYGTTTAYGSSSPANSTLVTSHSVTLSGLTASTLYHYQVQSADSAGSLGGSADSTFTTSSTPSSCPCSIWNSSATPRTGSANDNRAVELGVKFTADVSGYITGIRFYKGSQNTGTHTGSLWTSSGTRLATATFSGESSSGWQQVNFSSPVAIAANTRYVASYHTNVGFYSADALYFSSSSSDQPPLHALANGSSGGNGVYVYGAGGVFPTSNYNSTNYWVDVVFNTTQVIPTNYSISGTVTGGSGATVAMSGAGSATTTADGSGNFSFTGLANGSYVITPSKTGLTFTPTSRSVTVSNANVTGVAFTADLQSFSISGTITGGNGATVVLSGAGSATATANSSGNFSFSGLANGSYVVTPSKTGFTVSPASKSVTVNNANVTGVSFTATALTYSISGALSPAAGGGGATVALSGAASASTTADGSGNYGFSGLANGNYALTPSHTGYAFTPTSQAVSIANASVTGVNFTAAVAPITYTLSGNISPASAGAGSLVTLSGAASFTTTADAQGNYSFTSLANGAYTVTPSSQTATFSPTNQAVTISNGNVSGVNFTATATSSNVIFFDDFTGTSLSSAWTVISRHGEYAQAETECNSPQQVSVANGFLTIRTAAQASTCGDFNIDGSVRHGPSSWPYLTGDVQWTNFSFTYGTVEIRAKFPPKGTGLWPATWLLGKNCQNTNIYTADVGYSTCPTLSQSSYAEVDMTECDLNNWCQLALSNTNGFPTCGYSVDTNFHVFTLTWTSTSFAMAVDGQSSGCRFTSASWNIPSTPMFLIIQTQTGGAGGRPNNALLPADFVIDYVKVTQP